VLAFVTSVRHPESCENYREVEALLQATLASVLAQTSDDYVVIIVGNQPPSFPLPDRAHVVTVDFPPSRTGIGPKTEEERARGRRDKGTKLGIGLTVARQFDPHHVMFFDTDDFVHRDLAAYAAARTGEPGWAVDTGYVYSRRRQSIRKQIGFDRLCGSSLIVATDAYRIPADLPVTASQDEVLAAYGDVLTQTMETHVRAREWFAQQGFALEPLPFPGAVYHVDTGQNHSEWRNDLRGVARPLDARLAAEFGIPRTQSRAKALWGAAGPVPIAQTVLRGARRLLPVRRNRPSPRSAADNRPTDSQAEPLSR
jgi:hypothetical protein